MALVLHGVLFAVPLPESDDAVITEELDNPVDPVDDVDGVRLVMPPAPASSVPRLPIAPTPVAIATPSITPSASPLPVRPAAPPPVSEPVASEPVVSPPDPTPTPQASVSPTPINPEQDLTTPAQPLPEPTSALPDTADFPHMTGAQPSCGGQSGCWQIADTQWRAIARTFEQDLQDRGYDIDQLQLADDTGLRVYAVSKAGEVSYYLNLLSTLQGTLYILSDQPLSREALSEMAGVQS
ncbi:MAG: hypothetical protein SFY66_18060 [Oculatellaceae cyanobacterium bins.114]|nr:hypothetical protein [Oculatellaceae cyanobacterium bins.114]